MKKVMVLLIASVAVTACAQRADKIAPSYSSRSIYDSLSCQQVRSETDAVAASLNALSGAQNSKATSDALLTGVGVVLFWPALLFTSGAAGADDHSVEIGRLKGEAEALSGAYRAKGCSVAM